MAKRERAVMPSSRHRRESALRTILFDNMLQATSVKRPPAADARPVVGLRINQRAWALPGHATREEDRALHALAETARRCAMFVLGDAAWT